MSFFFDFPCGARILLRSNPGVPLCPARLTARAGGPRRIPAGKVASRLNQAQPISVSSGEIRFDRML